MKNPQKAIFCVAIVLFCTMLCLQAQEKYLSKADIDAYLTNFDKIITDEILDDPKMDIPFEEPINAGEFAIALGDFKEIFATVLQNYGLDSDSPIESFYTILLGVTMLQVEAEWEVMIRQAETEEERQMIEDEMRSDAEFTAILKLKDSIHPDDMSLLIENFRFLAYLMSGL